MTKTIRREMTITHADFFRIIPRALNSYDYEILPDRIEIMVNLPGGTIKIILSPEMVRSIGALRLPVTNVEILFSGLTQTQVDDFLKQFDLYFQKGGG